MLERFAAKCDYDPMTGCVLWKGGTSAGRGNTVRYGVFWFEGRRWFAHRWAAAFIHGLVIDDLTVGHICNNSLCVQHLRPETLAKNVADRNRRYFGRQSKADRQHWLLVGLGYREHPEAVDSPVIPFYEPPEWFAPYWKRPPGAEECPF